ncbi:MAG TPA: serine hydrolase domain-containing protein, partial [Chitinophagaceae bacterium]|nr:serine hydrolase domain-containing protein [Chitinophagaceae bacterium]
MKHWILLYSFLLPVVLSATAQDVSIERPDGKVITTSYVDSVALQLMDTAAVTGLELGLVSNGKVAYLNGYGYRNKAMQQLNDTSTCFYAASLAKSLFACLVMQLADEKKLSLDTPLYKYLPKPLPDYDNYKDLV